MMRWKRPERPAARKAERALDPDVGIPPLAVPYDVPPASEIPAAAPGEKPDRTDDTAGVPLDTLTWLKSAKAVLLAERFRREPLKQFRKPGQVWGVVRQEPGDLQTHVRAFKDGRLESEVELSNRYIQHFWSHRRSAHAEVKEILERHAMPTQHVSETFVPITGSHPDKKMPRGRVRHLHLALPALALLGAWLVLRYLKGRR